MSHAVIISPPFYSHAKPLATLGRAMLEIGVRVTFACIPELAYLARAHGLEFKEFEASSNRNLGTAVRTRQSAEDSGRLNAFLDATYDGAVAALRVQAINRQRDMLNNPAAMIDAISQLHRELQPAWFVVDQLSYPVTLALHCLGLRYASFCASHPSYIPRTSAELVGVPEYWPLEIRRTVPETDQLMSLALAVDEAFTVSFNQVMRESAPHRPPVVRAFELSSPYARVFNYPEIAAGDGRDRSRDLFMGHASDWVAPLPGEWNSRLARLTGGIRCIISFGTFLNVRTDVIAKVESGIRLAYPDAVIFIAAAGGNYEYRSSARTWVADRLPQQALLPHVDLIVHHGGNNTFTESAAVGVPALILPFGMDQFSVAFDAERLGVARCLDPNHITAESVAEAIRTARSWARESDIARLRDHVRGRGARWAAPRLSEQMSRSAA